jgi:DNA-binding NarL/FixJ family response regulator
LTEFSQNSPLTTTAGSADAPIRVALILSSKLERLGWGIVVDGQEDMQVVGQFSSLASAFALLKTDAADVVLVDETMLTPKACDAIRRHSPAKRPRFLVIARHPVEGAQEESRYSFASRYLLKGLSAADLLDAIRNSGSANGS